MSVHRARPAHPDDPEDHQPCAVCRREVKKVPGGQGPTWVHSETGAVAGPGSDDDLVTTQMAGRLEGLPRKVLDAAATGMPYRAQSKKAEVAAWIARYRPDAAQALLHPEESAQ